MEEKENGALTNEKTGYVSVEQPRKTSYVSVEQPRKRSYNPQLFKQPSSCNIDISFENISLQVTSSVFSKRTNQVLKGVSGLFKSGELTAIMGPSGAGKSSLLNVLSGFIKEGVGGSIFANNLLEDKRRKMKDFSVYIMQDDYLLPFFTVAEIMLHASNVKLGRSKTTSAKRLIIDNILESMSLSDSKNTRCGTLSGGEKKRLNVCLELIDNPSILFLDEPTTGLDSSSCGLLVSELKGLALGGRTVICTIHQPSAAVFYMFDHLYFLVDGKVLYQGATSNLLSFLDYINLPCPIFHNPADFLMDVATGEFGSYTDKFSAAMRSRNWRNDAAEPGANCNGNSSVVPKDESFSQILTNKSERPSEWEKCLYLVPQLIKQLHRDWVVTYFKVLVNILTGVLVGLMFTDTGNTAVKIFPNLGFVFIGLAYFCFTSLMPAALRFPGEMKVLRKEHFNNWYKFTSFYLAFLLVNIPLQIILVSLYAVPAYLLSGQVLEGKRFLVYYVVNINSSLISVVLGLYMGALGPVHGVFGGSIFIIVMAVLGGFCSFVNTFPPVLYEFSFLSFLRHSFEVILTGLYGMGRANLPCPKHLIYCHYKNPKTVFKDTGFDPENLIRDVVLLILLTSSATLITFLKLRAALKNVK